MYVYKDVELTKMAFNKLYLYYVLAKFASSISIIKVWNLVEIFLEKFYFMSFLFKLG